jgi:SHS2 domain-containing protein
MEDYEILEHKADLKIRAFGKTKEELFSNMLKGMISGLRPEILNSEAEKRNIEIKSSDLESLLVDFLSEVLYLTQVNKEIYINIKFKKLTDPSTSSGQVAELKGELVGQKVQRFGEDIKAVTYHQLNIHQNENGVWEATVLFDI